MVLYSNIPWNIIARGHTERQSAGDQRETEREREEREPLLYLTAVTYKILLAVRYTCMYMYILTSAFETILPELDSLVALQVA